MCSNQSWLRQSSSIAVGFNLAEAVAWLVIGIVVFLRFRKGSVGVLQLLSFLAFARPTRELTSGYNGINVNMNSNYSRGISVI